MTANDVFEITVDLISERLDSGLKDTTNTANYEKRTPGLLNIIQAELARDLYILESDSITSTNTDKYIEYTNPDDFMSFYKLTNTDLETKNDYRIIGNKLYLYDGNENYILFYKKMPTKITALTDTMLFDDYVCSVVIPNGLASLLLLTENVALSNFFNQRYEELKLKADQKEPREKIAIIDKYDSSLNY